jgi:hypothetical protein
VAGELGSTPATLAADIDWLFTSATLDLAATARERREAQLALAAAQRLPYGADQMPPPGGDAEMEQLIRKALAQWDFTDPPAGLLHDLVERMQAYFGAENKRKNLVGEGFEDVMAAVLNRIPAIESRYRILVRPVLHDLPGFYPARAGDKTKKVDLALIRNADRARTLVSCKWSVRSDREEQFAADFEAYSRLESSGQRFGYVLITNEFDPARLAAACDSRAQNAELFSSVVHVNPAGPLAAYEAPTGSRRTGSGGIQRATDRIGSGRLSSLQAWLTALAREADS